MTCKFHGENWYSWYCAISLMGCYAVGELGHFLIGIVSRPMAQEIKFGDEGCLTNNSVVEEQAKLKCKELNISSCSMMKFNGTTFCKWDYTGSGVEYQVLAGPAFIAIFTIMGIFIGVIGDMYNRIRLLTICVVGYSLMAGLTGLCSQYWQLIILRFGFAAGEAGCTPLTASIVADMFGNRSRALAMSIFNWGIYLGFGLAFTVGSYVTKANILGQGWRWAYYLTGIPGFAMATVLFITVKEPKRKDVCAQRSPKKNAASAGNDTEESLLKFTEQIPEKTTSSACGKLLKVITTFAADPAIVMLLVAASIRHTASFCWAYNTQLYFNQYYPDFDLGIWMFLCSTVGGSIGIASGGIISDLVVSRYGISMRLWVLVGSQAIASPLAAMVLYLDPPYCFISLLSAYLFAEMWYGVMMTIVVEMVPTDIRSTAVASFHFVIANIGGNLPVVVASLKLTVGGLRQALYIVYPGFYLLSSFFFLMTQLLIWKRNSSQKEVPMVADEIVKESAE